MNAKTGMKIILRAKTMRTVKSAFGASSDSDQTDSKGLKTGRILSDTLSDLKADSENMPFREANKNRKNGEQRSTPTGPLGTDWQVVLIGILGFVSPGGLGGTVPFWGYRRAHWTGISSDLTNHLGSTRFERRRDEPIKPTQKSRQWRNWVHLARGFLGWIHREFFRGVCPSTSSLDAGIHLSHFSMVVHRPCLSPFSSSAYAFFPNQVRFPDRT